MIIILVIGFLKNNKNRDPVFWVQIVTLVLKLKTLIMKHIL